MYVMYIKVDKKWLSVKELQKGLDFIHDDAKGRAKKYNPLIHRVQILTSGVRSTWAAHRKKLTSGKIMIFQHLFITWFLIYFYFTVLIKLFL